MPVPLSTSMSERKGVTFTSTVIGQTPDRLALAFDLKQKAVYLKQTYHKPDVVFSASVFAWRLSEELGIGKTLPAKQTLQLFAIIL